MTALLTDKMSGLLRDVLALAASNSLLETSQRSERPRGRCCPAGTRRPRLAAFSRSKDGTAQSSRRKLRLRDVSFRLSILNMLGKPEGCPRLRFDRRCRSICECGTRRKGSRGIRLWPFLRTQSHANSQPRGLMNSTTADRTMGGNEGCPSCGRKGGRRRPGKDEWQWHRTGEWLDSPGQPDRPRHERPESAEPRAESAQLRPRAVGAECKHFLSAEWPPGLPPVLRIPTVPTI